MVSRRPAPAALRAVERDPGTVAVVPLAPSGPPWSRRRVDGADPVRDAAARDHLTVTGDVMLVRGVPTPLPRSRR